MVDERTFDSCMIPAAPPRMVTDWYTDAITVLEQCRDRDLILAKELAQQLVRVNEPDAR